MKKAVVTLLLLLAPVLVGMSQSVISGVYMSYEDFLSGKLEYAINCSEESHKIRSQGDWNRDRFKVVHRGTKFIHDRSEVFGYRDCAGKDWRLYGKDDYQIAEKRSIIIYRRYAVSNSDPETGKIRPSYYFSVDNGDLLKLTKANLKKTFPDNHHFHDKLDETFSGGEPVSAYDNFHKMYKVNRVLAVTGN